MIVAFDVDGTLFDNEHYDHGRSKPFASPRPEIIKQVMAHHASGDYVIVWSGRGIWHAWDAVNALGLQPYVNSVMAKDPSIKVDMAYDDDPWLLPQLVSAGKVVRV